MYVVYFEHDNTEHYVSLHSTLAGALRHIKITDEGGPTIAGKDTSESPTDWPAAYLVKFGKRVRIYRVNIDDDKPSEEISWLWRMPRSKAA